MAWMQRINDYWYRPFRIWQWPFRIFSYVHQIVLEVRRWMLRHWFQWIPPVPLVVVGNITVGGVGKTPLVIAMAQRYQALGYQVGVVSRGYRSQVQSFPYEVKLSDDPAWVGDEPYLIHRRTSCPVMIAPKRVQAVKALLARHRLDLIISDDGLQHEALGRHVELVVVDGTRGFGNGCLFPWGPLRESARRLEEVDAVIMNASQSLSSLGGQKEVEPLQFQFTPVYTMTMQNLGFYDLKTHQPQSLDAFMNQPLLAIAGIGNPERFFQQLRDLGLTMTPRAFPDHHAFKASDWSDWVGPLVMTEKDAVKCQGILQQPAYYLAIQAQLSEQFWQDLDHRLNFVSSKLCDPTGVH